jgi:hypothetical protein
MGKVLPYSILLVLFGSLSCTKTGIQQNNPHPGSLNIFGFTDSTQLIKSITYQSQDSSGSQYFFYDTVNRKIIVSMQPISTASQAYTDGEEFFYDANGLLVHTDAKFVVPADVYFSSADYTYDDQHVLQSASTTLFGGVSYSAEYTKTAVPGGGYLLSTLSTLPGDNGYTDSNYTAVYIDNNNRFVSFYQTYNVSEVGINNTSPNGDTYFNYLDTIIYDASGSMRKWISTNPPDPLKADSLVTYTTYDYSARDSRGDQLYNLGRVLYNGIDNVPFQIIDFYAGELSSLGDIGMQTYKYPTLQTSFPARDSLGNSIGLLNFNSPAQYDDSSRLIKYHNFTHYYPYAGYDILIAYYK